MSRDTFPQHIDHRIIWIQHFVALFVETFHSDHLFVVQIEKQNLKDNVMRKVAEAVTSCIGVIIGDIIARDVFVVCTIWFSCPE